MELQNTVTGQRVRAVVTDRGPFIAGRDVDLSHGPCQKSFSNNQGSRKAADAGVGTKQF